MIVTSLLKWRNFRDSFQFNKNTTHSALCEVMNAVMIPLVQTRSNVDVGYNITIYIANSHFLFFLTVSIMEQ